MKERKLFLDKAFRSKLAARLVGGTLAVAITFCASANGAGDEITAAEIRAHVDYLASEKLAGRAAGQAGAELAAGYIAQQFASYGFQPLRDGWQLPFYVRGAATDGQARLVLAGETIQDETLVQVPNYSAVGLVRAPVATTDADQVAGKIVVAVAKSDERSQASRLLERRAAAVVLLRDEEVLEPTPPMHRFIMIGEEAIEKTLARLPEKSRKQLLDTIRLSAPVVVLSTRLRDVVLRAAADGSELSIDVTRRGKDESTNVIGILVGRDPKLRDEYVVIGGHYDHIGVRSGDIYPGADDNASGTSAVLEIAEAFATLDRRPRRSIVVVAWGAEEPGMVGSVAFCRNPPIELDKIAALINLDMIGRNDPNAVQVLAAGDGLRKIAVAAAARHGLSRTNGNPEYLGATDSGPFVQRNIPSVFFHTGEHADYNTPRDTADRLDIDKIVRIARTAFDVALDIANSDKRPTFSAGSGESPR